MTYPLFHHIYKLDDYVLQLCVGSLTDKWRTKNDMRKYEMNNRRIGLQRQWLAATYLYS